MKVKNHHSEYKDWKTKAHCQYGAKFYIYYGPDNVRDINEGKPKQGELGL